MGFVEEAFAEVDEMERQKILNDEKVKSLILQKSAKISAKQYGTVVVRFRTSITKKLRKRLILAKKSLETDEGMDVFLYETLALICTEPPFNDKNTWMVYDNELPEDGIGAMEIFTDMMAEITAQAKAVQGFR